MDGWCLISERVAVGRQYPCRNLPQICLFHVHGYLLPIATLFYTLYNIQSVAVFLLFELRPPPVHFYRLLALDAGVLALVISRINHGARVRAQRILMN